MQLFHLKHFGSYSPRIAPRGSVRTNEANRSRVTLGSAVLSCQRQQENKGLNSEVPRFEVTDCLFFCVMLFSAVCVRVSVCVCVYSINLSTHWPFSTDVVCAADKHCVHPQCQHSDILIDRTNMGSKNKSRSSHARKK